MGHTVLSQRQVVDLLLQELHDFGKALRPEERQALDELLRHPLRHVGSISYVSSINTWAFLLLAIALEQQKRIAQLEQRDMDATRGRVSEREPDYPLAQSPP
jgi:hypothetical protein